MDNHFPLVAPEYKAEAKVGLQGPGLLTEPGASGALGVEGVVSWVCVPVRCYSYQPLIMPRGLHQCPLFG